MAKYAHIADDAQGFDPSINPEMVVSIYEVGGKTVRVPVSLRMAAEAVPTVPEAVAALDTAVFTAAGIDPSITQLYSAWEAIKVQAASRPIADMDITQMHTWINANITGATNQLAFRNVATELFIIRAQMRIIEALFRNIFDNG